MRRNGKRIRISGNRPGRRCHRPVPGFAVIIMSIMAMLTAILLVPVSRQFIVEDDLTGEVLYSTAVDPGDVFSIKYIHSVNKSPVEDVFEIQDDNGIMLKKTIFRSFGAGIPYELEDGQIMDVMDDRIEISNINRRIGKFLLKIGTIAEHTLCINGREIRMDSLAKPKQTVRLEVRSVPVTFFLRGITNERK
jgi:hypothetical protein